MRNRCVGPSSCNVIHLTSDTDPGSSIFCQTSSAGHPVPNPSLSSSPTSHVLCDSHLQVVEPRLHIRAKTLLCGFRRLEVCPPCHSIVVCLQVEEHTLRVGRSVTCTAFPYVTLHSQPFPITRLVAVLCYTCYFVPPNGLGALPNCCAPVTLLKLSSRDR